MSLYYVYLVTPNTFALSFHRPTNLQSKLKIWWVFYIFRGLYWELVFLVSSLPGSPIGRDLPWNCFIYLFNEPVCIRLWHLNLSLEYLMAYPLFSQPLIALASLLWCSYHWNHSLDRNECLWKCITCLKTSAHRKSIPLEWFTFCCPCSCFAHLTEDFLPTCLLIVHNLIIQN